jgi:hypothetical protein
MHWLPALFANISPISLLFELYLIQVHIQVLQLVPEVPDLAPKRHLSLIEPRRVQCSLAKLGCPHTPTQENLFVPDGDPYTFKAWSVSHETRGKRRFRRCLG